MDITTENNKTAKVQHVTKKSSDELLRKFADEEEDEGKKEIVRLSKRRKRSNNKRSVGNEYSWCETPSHYTTTNNGLVEKRCLLLPQVSRKSLLLRQLGIGRSQLKARDIPNRSFLVAIERTWRKTLEGASKVLVEKHYNRHKRLISDVV